MRAPALASLLSMVAFWACGRVGYDQLADEIDAPDPIDAPTDADIDAPPGVLANCGEAVKVHDWGLAESATLYGIDVTPTDLGFVIAWTAGADQVRATGIAVTEGPRLNVIQPLSVVVGTTTSATMSIAALGDDAMLGVDDPGGPGIRLYALDERGMERATAKYIDNDRAYGHAFVSADDASTIFLVMGAQGTATSVYRRDRDIHPITGPDAAFPVATESAGASPVGGGYVFMTGNSSNCDVKKVDTNFTPIGSPQPISMTCHNASAVKAVGSNSVVFGWNCDNDAVWVTGGDPATALPTHHAVFGDASNSSSNPRLAATPDGIWYAYRVAGGSIGRALLDATGNTVTGAEPLIVRTSAAIKAYDLAVHGDMAFLFWIESSARTELWSMKLCAP
jgi:hypothetical protein